MGFSLLTCILLLFLLLPLSHHISITIIISYHLISTISPGNAVLIDTDLQKARVFEKGLRNKLDARVDMDAVLACCDGREIDVSSSSSSLIIIIIIIIINYHLSTIDSFMHLYIYTLIFPPIHPSIHSPYISLSPLFLYRQDPHIILRSLHWTI